MSRFVVVVFHQLAVLIYNHRYQILLWTFIILCKTTTNSPYSYSRLKLNYDAAVWLKLNSMANVIGKDRSRYFVSQRANYLENSFRCEDLHLRWRLGAPGAFTEELAMRSSKHTMTMQWSLYEAPFQAAVGADAKVNRSPVKAEKFGICYTLPIKVYFSFKITKKSKFELSWPFLSINHTKYFSWFRTIIIGEKCKNVYFSD